MSKFEQIEAFLYVVQENSFARAARRLGVSTPAISKQINRLEKDLNAQLLLRTTRHVSLSEIGLQYYQHCKNAMAELSKADAVITGSQVEPAGSLLITSNRHFANEYLIPYLPEFMSLYPQLIIHLELAERFPDFKKEDIDILFGTSIEGPPDLVRKRITSTRYVACASPDYLKKHGTPKTPEDLSHHRYITHMMRKPDNIIPFRNDKTICVNPIMFLNDSQAMLECALLGMGIVLLHNYIVRENIKKGLLFEILSDFQEPEKPIYLYYQHQRYLQPKIRHCIDFFTKKINLDPAFKSKMNKIQKNE